MKTVTVQAQQRWEYCVETRKTESSLLVSLNKFGQEGWDLVEVLYYKDMKGVMEWTAFLKRPSTAATPPVEQQAAASSVPTNNTRPKPTEPQGVGVGGDEYRMKAE
ncbi:MAG: hypothetical protein ABFC96_01480 [Thermoguttaceae bacterium]